MVRAAHTHAIISRLCFCWAADASHFVRQSGIIDRSEGAQLHVVNDGHILDRALKGGTLARLVADAAALPASSGA
jgi:hypothetical protein